MSRLSHTPTQRKQPSETKRREDAITHTHTGQNHGHHKLHMDLVSQSIWVVWVLSGPHANEAWRADGGWMDGWMTLSHSSRNTRKAQWNGKEQRRQWSRKAEEGEEGCRKEGGAASLLIPTGSRHLMPAHSSLPPQHHQGWSPNTQPTFLPRLPTA